MAETLTTWNFQCFILRCTWEIRNGETFKIYGFQGFLSKKVTKNQILTPKIPHLGKTAATFPPCLALKNGSDSRKDSLLEPFSLIFSPLQINSNQF